MLVSTYYVGMHNSQDVLKERSKAIVIACFSLHCEFFKGANGVSLTVSVQNFPGCELLVTSC